MLYSMDKSKFNADFMFPILKKIEKSMKPDDDPYMFYFCKMIDSLVLNVHDYTLGFDSRKREDYNANNFALYMAHYYRDRSKDRIYRENEKRLAQDLEKMYAGHLCRSQLSSHITYTMQLDEILENVDIFNRIRMTWIGERIFILSSLKENIQKEISLKYEEL